MASRSLGQLTIDLIAKVGGFTAGMTQAERAADKSARKMKQTFSGIQSSVKKAFAFVGVGLLVREIIKNTAEAEAAFALLDNAVKASGGAAGYTTQQLADLSSELQKTTTFSDEAIQGAEQLLLRFQSIQGIQFDRALESTLDLATALGKDLSSAAILVGKALEDPAKGMTALAKAGVVLEKEQKDLILSLQKAGREQEAQNIILDELQKRYGGAAEAARNTFGGALAALGNAASDLLEAKGGLPELTDEINNLTDALNNPNTRRGMDNLLSGLARAGGVLLEFLTEFGSLGEVLARWQAQVDGNLSQMDELEGELIDLDRAINGSFMAKPLPWLFKNTAQLEKMREETLAQIEALKKAQGFAGDLDPVAAGGKRIGTAPPATDEFLKMEADLLEQIALHGKVGKAAKIAYDIQAGALDALHPEEQKRILDLARTYDALGKVGESTGLTFTAIEQMAMDVGEAWRDLRLEVEGTLKAMPNADEINEMLQANTGAMLEESTEKYKKAVEEQNEFMLEASRNTQDILADSFYDAMNGSFDNILESFYDMLQKMVAQALAADVASKLFGDAGVGSGGGWIGSGIDWLSKLFGGGRASGGPVNAGHLYRVNEAGTEMLSTSSGDYLMMGKEGGTVTPAHQLVSGTGTVHQIINVTGSVTERTARQIALESGRSQRAAQRLA